MAYVTPAPVGAYPAAGTPRWTPPLGLGGRVASTPPMPSPGGLGGGGGGLLNWRPTMPTSLRYARTQLGRGTQINPAYPGTGAVIRRGLLGAGIQYGGSAITDQLGDNYGGHISGAMTAGGTIGSAGGPMAAGAVAAGAGLGEAIGAPLASLLHTGSLDQTSNYSLTNVGDNVSRKLGGPGSIGSALGAGVDPVALVKAMRVGDETAAALAIADAYGIKPDENGDLTLTGDANDALLAAREATHDPEDDPMGRLLYDLATTNASDEKIQATLDTYAAMMAENPELEPGAAISQAQDYVAQQEEALAAQAHEAKTQFAQIAALQAQVQQYMAPVTGGMRERADMMRASTEQTLANANLPPQMAAGLQMQMDAQYQSQMALADAYDRQIAITPQMLMQQEAQQRNQDIAAQLQQQQDAAMISGYMNPMGGATGGLDLASLGIDPSMAALVTG